MALQDAEGCGVTWVKYEISDRGLLEFRAPAFVTECPKGSVLKGSPEGEAARAEAMAEQVRVFGRDRRTRAKRRKLLKLARREGRSDV